MVVNPGGKAGGNQGQVSNSSFMFNFKNLCVCLLALVCVYECEFGVSVTVYVLGGGYKKRHPIQSTGRVTCRISLHLSA